MLQVVVFLMHSGHGTGIHLGSGDLGPGASPALYPGPVAAQGTLSHLSGGAADTSTQGRDYGKT